MTGHTMTHDGLAASTTADDRTSTIAAPLLEARAVGRSFAQRGTGGLWRARQTQLAVDGVSMQIHPGEVVALVGESGSGKTTLGRILLGLTAPSSGQVLFRGEDVAGLRGEAWARFRREVQVVFQDTGGSLNPRHTIGQSVALPLRHNRGLDAAACAREVDALLEQVGLPPAHFRHRLPHELSGGQRQRVGIARALASQPAVIVADEPVSALDVSIRAQILRLMAELQRARGLAYLFITHDLGVVRALADRVLVMTGGRVVESGSADEVLERPQHAYTQRLLAATPVPDPGRQLMRDAQAQQAFIAKGRTSLAHSRETGELIDADEALETMRSRMASRLAKAMGSRTDSESR